MNLRLPGSPHLRWDGLQRRPVEMASFGIASAAAAAFTAGSSILAGVVQHEACAPLVDAILGRAPALGSAVVLAALEAAGVDAYRQLAARTGREVDEEVVTQLLAPAADGGASRWSRLVMQRGKRPLIAELTQRHTRLRDATATPEMLISAATPATTATACWLLELGVGVTAEVRAALLCVRSKEECAKEPAKLLVDGLDEPAADVPYAGRYVQTGRKVGGQPVYRGGQSSDGGRAIWYFAAARPLRPAIGSEAWTQKGE